MIPKETIDRIFETARIEEVVGDFVALKRAGVNYKGLSPFVKEKTPSFFVSPSKNIYKCFSSGKGGNAVGFLMELEHYTYPEALKYLADKYDIEIEEEEQSPQQLEAANARESLYIVSNYAAEYFKETLHNSSEGKAIGLSYFKERGFSDEIIEKFMLGYSPESKDAFTENAIKKGYKATYLEKAGLTIIKEDRRFDRFNGRVIFPIQNVSGRVLGFGARILKSDKNSAKYLNSPESDIYHKSKILYGIYHAKKAIIQEDNCYLVEGYTDVISLHQSGVENVVASSGTALTPDQIRLISRYTQNITILYDGDAAGIRASFRGIDLILEEGMNVKVVLFPDGDDPDSYAKKVSNPELKEYIKEHAQDFIRFKVDVLQKETKNDPIKRTEMIRDVISSIAHIADHIKRSVYVKECSNLLQIDEHSLTLELNKLRGKKKTADAKARLQEDFPEEIIAGELTNERTPSHQKQLQSKPSGIEHLENNLIRLLIIYGNHSIWVDIEDEKGKTDKTEVALAEYIIHELERDEIAFVSPLYKEIYTYFQEQIEKGNIPESNNFANHTDSAISNLAIDFSLSKYTLSENWTLRHNIHVQTEEHLLKEEARWTLYSLKRAVILKMMEEIDQELKTLGNGNGYEDLLIRKKQLKEAEKAFASELGISINH